MIRRIALFVALLTIGLALPTLDSFFKDRLAFKYVYCADCKDQSKTEKIKALDICITKYMPNATEIHSLREEYQDSENCTKKAVEMGRKMFKDNKMSAGKIIWNCYRKYGWNTKLDKC